MMKSKQGGGGGNKLLPSVLETSAMHQISSNNASMQSSQIDPNSQLNSQRTRNEAVSKSFVFPAAAQKYLSW